MSRNREGIWWVLAGAMMAVGCLGALIGSTVLTFGPAVLFVGYLLVNARG